MYNMINNMIYDMINDMMTLYDEILNIKYDDNDVIYIIRYIV